MCGDGVRDSGCPVCRNIGDGDMGAFLAEHARRRAAHAASGASDENGEAAHRAAE